MPLDCAVRRMPRSIVLRVIIFVEWLLMARWLRPTKRVLFSRGHVGGRAIIDRQTIHIHDISAGFDTEFPGARTLYERTGVRTILATPLLREGVRLEMS